MSDCTHCRKSHLTHQTPLAECCCNCHRDIISERKIVEWVNKNKSIVWDFLEKLIENGDLDEENIIQLLVLYCDDCITVHTIKSLELTNKNLRCRYCNSDLRIIDTCEPHMAKPYHI